MVYLLQDYVSKNAEKNPNSLMIQDGDDTITYGGFEKYTNKFAKILISCGIQRGDIITFYMKKSINAFKSLISILKADAIYAPLDIQTPDKRVHFILKNSKCKFILCDSKSYIKTLKMLATFDEEITIINMDSRIISNKEVESLNDRDEISKIEKRLNKVFIEDHDELDDNKRNYQNIDTDIAYIIYTSGSTGLPKGVMINHRNVIDYAEWTVDFFRIEKQDRLSNHPGLYFDLSTFDVYTAFKSGASLHLVPKSISMFPIKIVEFIEKNKITLWNSVPSLLTFIAKSGVIKKGRMPTLKILTFCGEVMPTQTVIEWMKAYPHLRCVNQYGPTETTCASMYYEIKEIPKDPAKPVPIGKAIPNTEVFSITEDGRRAKVGEIAELHIRGSGNGVGYLNNKAKTKEVFVKNPLNPYFEEIIYATGDMVQLRKDNNYDFIGRKDHQIKYMGFRVELGEIESTLNSLHYVKSSAAFGLESKETGGTIIIAYVELKETKTVKLIKKDIGKKIPHYMVPKKILLIEKMPYNANDKIDRVRLKKQYYENK